MLLLIIPAAIVVIAVWGYIRLGRHGESVVPAAGWQRTAESFRDPSSGRLMRVWIDPVDGSRHYVAEGGPARRT